MFGREERIALILVLTVIVIIGTFAVFMENRGIDMFAASYSEDVGQGALVMISGTADEVRNTVAGGHITASVNGIRVFIPADAGCPLITDGDYIHVNGIVDEYMGEREIRAINIEIRKKTN